LRRTIPAGPRRWRLDGSTRQTAAAERQRRTTGPRCLRTSKLPGRSRWRTWSLSFLDPGLQAKLAAVDAKNLVIVGFITHRRIFSTVRAAFDLGDSNPVMGAATAA
jgi:hypothetical protein